ncbi:hypothetical protein ABPG73_004437 [Tetrahymena malaccensis]
MQTNRIILIFLQLIAYMLQSIMYNQIVYIFFTHLIIWLLCNSHCLSKCFGSILKKYSFLYIMAEQLKLNKKVLQQNDDCINLQQLTTKEIIKTILSSEKPIPHIQQQLQQNKLKQYKLLKYTKANLDFDLMHKENEELKKYQQTDYIFENFQSQDEFESLNDGYNKVYFNKYKSQPSQQDIAFNDIQFQEYQMKHINKNSYKKKLIQNNGITINYASQPSINYKGEDNRYNFITQNLESENCKEHNFQQNLFQQSKQIQESGEISQYNKPIKNSQINLEQLQNNVNFNPNTSVQPHNAFLRKNSRMHIIRRSLIDIFNSNSRQPSPPQDCESQNKINSNFESLKHSLSQCEISQMAVDNRIFDSSFLSQHYNQNMNECGNYHIRNHRQNNRSFHQNPLSKSMVNSQRSSLQDILNKKKQEKCNQIFLGFNNILLHKNKIEQKVKNSNEVIEPNQSKKANLSSQEQVSQQNINKKDLSLIKKMPLIKLRSNSQHSSRFYSKSSRLNNEMSSLEATYRKERQQQQHEHLEDKQQTSNQNLNLNHSEVRQSQHNLHESSLCLKEIQFPNGSFNQKQKNFQKKRSNSQEKQAKSIDLLKLVPNQKEETDKLKQNKMIQQFLQHMREQNQNQSNQSSKNGISNLISQNSQPKIVSTFQYQPIQSINVTKYNEFKLSKKRRAFSIQNCQFVENQNLQEQQQQEQNQNKLVNNKYYHALLEQYDPQSIQILRSKIISYENREDKGFDLNSFLYTKYINFIKNPVINKNYNEIKSQQMKNIRKTYSLKNNDLLQRSTSIKKSQTQSPQLVFKSQEDIEKNIHFGGWDDTFDLNKRDDLENYLKESNKRDWIF